MLRPYQSDCVNASLSRRAAGVKRQLISLFTSGGKTVIFANLPQYMPVDKRMMMVVHTDELVRQAVKNIKHWNPGLEVGVEKAEQYAGDERVVVASIQTLGTEAGYKRLARFNPNDFYFLIIDEAHHATAVTYKNVIRHFGLFESAPYTTLCGFTATPNRGDGQALGQVFDETVFEYGIQDGLRDGWLVDPIGIRIRLDADISKVGTKKGDFDKDQLAAAVNTPACNEEMVRRWMEEAWPRRTIGFTVNVKHAEDMAVVFQRQGIAAQAISGKDSRDVQRQKIAAFASGEIMVLLNCQLMIEGVDIWQIECVLDAAPCKSQGKVVQKYGRGFRLQEGIWNMNEYRAQGLLKDEDKSDCLIMDGACNTGKHSLVTLSTLFGLGADLDLKGRSVRVAAKAIEDVQRQYPNLDMSKLKDITQIKSYIESANLWAVRFAEDVMDFSKLQWHSPAPKTYRLLLPKGEQVVVTEDLTGKYTVAGVVNTERFEERNIKSLAEAIRFADRTVSTKGKEILTLLRRESKWHSEPVSDGQRALLKKLKVPDAAVAKMNKGDAAKLITSRFGNKQP